MRSTLDSKALSSLVAVLVIVIIILAAGLGYFAIYGNKTAASFTTTTVTSSTDTVTSKSASPNPLILFSADAYVNESTALESGFTAQTGTPMATPVGAGASTLAANIKAGDPVSVFLSVSRSAVEGPALGSEFPGWAIAFAADQIGIAYTSTSTTTSAAMAVLSAYNAATSTNTTSAWYDFFNNLTSGQIKVGMSNPNDDPAGFRAWMVLQLAGIAYNGGLSGQQYFVNRMISNHGNVTAASAAALVPALETGQINFLFIYKSDIASEGLNLIQLRGGVNLGVPSYNSFYSQATYMTSGGLEKGAAIVLWLTVPKDSTDTANSVNFVVYTIKNYQTTLRSFGLVSIVPVQLYNTTGYEVPAPIVSLLNNGTLVDQGPV
ncbi:MAG: substrate-binding domain-containing protein [Nitrososphaerota archaeon]|nr:substrate-binding domain-containing protein [Nitrososphaerota archaeon]